MTAGKFFAGEQRKRRCHQNGRLWTRCGTAKRSEQSLVWWVTNLYLSLSVLQAAEQPLYFSILTSLIIVTTWWHNLSTQFFHNFVQKFFCSWN